MSATAPTWSADVRSDLSPAEFYRDYVNKRPVLMKGALAHLPATRSWSLPYFAEIAPDLPVRLKVGRVADGRTSSVRMADYCASVLEWEALPEEVRAEREPPAYLHDVPLLAMVPRLRDELKPFPAELLPSFFAKQWWEFPQFFVGPSRAVTPLHFDTLLTHNLFFQFHGSKRFVMVAPEDRDRAYTYNWRWSGVDPDAPDYEKNPRFEGVQTTTRVVEAGDVLYMPPGTLHKVTSLSASVSFNIDWHDPVSAVRSVLAVKDGMPIQNLRYNLLFALGVCGRIPLKVLMPALKSYFVYIS
ncbi:cupin-like domain-containing protein [Saccharothrix sp. Mg75]|uniref:cupin-like domain-containing protein n=1 Tax=Saccharothrix sp. Mg75 TaxID=3445357 RepID=UPI003EEECD80